MDQAKLVSINSLTDLKNKPTLQPYEDPSPDGPTIYTSPKGKTFDPLQHEVDKVSGEPAIRADGEFKMLRGWQGAMKTQQAKQHEQSDIETDIIKKDENEHTTDNPDESIRVEPQFLPDDMGHQPPDFTPDPEQRSGNDSGASDEFDIPTDNTYFDDPANAAEADRREQVEIDKYIEARAHEWIEGMEGVMVMAIGDEWILTEDEHRILQRPAARCMKKYGIYELWPEVDLLVALIMVSKNRLNPKTHPKTSTIWQGIKFTAAEKWRRFWFWARSKKPDSEEAQQLTEEEEEEAQVSSKPADGEQV